MGDPHDGRLHLDQLFQKATLSVIPPRAATTAGRPKVAELCAKSATGNAPSADASNERETYDDAWLAVQVMAP